ncbi:hypothetical protein MGYG_08960 [Nannizzia gypsea CBS 118893]|uniref:Uncharacterized protein n=1 Tax=Arthroderma gypseum (strain ATCC MYA-4604 / CBS 118893) TaxID=535722 RepID=E4UPP3_ARTGP|nr:hypothetical protein MGYG_08960 [Nannizzia gypsea CBS 118893]EFQ99080.1 hypothetical protein MGYG_08960 [Nannizzia gypsea CBS 118893]
MDFCSQMKRRIRMLLRPEFSRAVKSWAIENSPPKEKQPPIYALHGDAIYCIISSLPPADAAAFVLASKFFWQVAGGQTFLNRMLSDTASRLDFLERIEACFPKHVLCYRCQKFHVRCKEYPLLKPGQCDAESAIHFFGPKTMEGMKHTPCLLYREAKDVMNHYRFGPRHGKCAATVTHTRTFFLEISSSPFPTHGVWNFDIKYISNNLILKEDIWIMYHLARPADGKSLLDGWKNHLLPTISLDGEEVYYRYRCPVSSSEREFRVSRLRHRPGHKLIRSTIWENLGPCKNSYGSLWEHGTEFTPCKSNPVVIKPEELRYKHHFDSKIPSRDYRGQKINFW